MNTATAWSKTGERAVHCSARRQRGCERGNGDLDTAVKRAAAWSRVGSRPFSWYRRGGVRRFGNPCIIWGYSRKGLRRGSRAGSRPFPGIAEGVRLSG